MTTLIDEECYEIDPDTETYRPKLDFLKDVEDSIEKNDDSDILRERLDSIKNMLLDRVNQNAIQKKRRRASISSVSSLDGRKRQWSGETDSQRYQLSESSPFLLLQLRKWQNLFYQSVILILEDILVLI